MCIKPSMAMILLLLGVSFSAYSEETYRVASTSVSGDSCSVSVGLTGTTSMITAKLKSCQLVFRGRTYGNCFVSGTTIRCNAWYGRAYSAGTLTPATCPDGEELNPETGRCEPKSCTEGFLKKMTWPIKYGNSPSFCVSGCAASSKLVVCGSFDDGTGDCTGDIHLTGETCAEDGITPGGSTGGNGGDSGSDGGDSGSDGGDSGSDGGDSGSDGGDSGSDGGDSGSDGGDSGSDGGDSGSDGGDSGSDGGDSGSDGGDSGSDGGDSGSDGGDSGSDGGDSGSDGGDSGSDGGDSGSDGGDSSSGGGDSGNGGGNSGNNGGSSGGSNGGSGNGKFNDRALLSAIGKVKGAIGDMDTNLSGSIDGLSDKLDELLGGNGRSFTEPTSTPWIDSTLMDAAGEMKQEVEQLTEKYEQLVTQSPLKLGQMQFNNGRYETTAFTLRRADWDVNVEFNLFGILGSNNMATIRNVIIFMASLFAAFIILSSGRKQ